jgi:hypothetical protein
MYYLPQLYEAMRLIAFQERKSVAEVQEEILTGQRDPIRLEGQDERERDDGK